MSQTAKFFTVGDISKQEDVSQSRVKYAIDANHIQPVMRAGIIRMFSEEQVEQISAAIQRIARSSTGG